tara:strand:- start:1105 stop:1437 length:333 start_codon:yes stop_codon:yes gene_type:complete
VRAGWHPDGGELAIGDWLDFNFEIESAEELMSRDGFGGLDQVAHVTRRERIQYPVQRQRRRVEGYVKLLVFISIPALGSRCRRCQAIRIRSSSYLQRPFASLCRYETAKR